MGGKNKMMNFNEGVAMRYGIKEAVIAQHLWELGENIDNADAALKDSRLWVRASASAIKCALPYFSKHQIKDAIMHLRKEHILIKREMNDSRFDRTNWYAFSDYGVDLMEGEYA